jgi:hypothetical protein
VSKIEEVDAGPPRRSARGGPRSITTVSSRRSEVHHDGQLEEVSPRSSIATRSSSRLAPGHLVVTPIRGGQTPAMSSQMVRFRSISSGRLVDLPRPVGSDHPLAPHFCRFAAGAVVRGANPGSASSATAPGTVLTNARPIGCSLSLPHSLQSRTSVRLITGRSAPQSRQRTIVPSGNRPAWTLEGALVGLGVPGAASPNPKLARSPGDAGPAVTGGRGAAISTGAAVDCSTLPIGTLGGFGARCLWYSAFARCFHAVQRSHRRPSSVRQSWSRYDTEHAPPVFRHRSR